mmetsp:Transcript_21979/g.52799  ORF Transcript_21979/g.52799 Transcript_21979/m.52799 type:complete len:227 (+) Transcript_21979:1495-2175(+)
MKNVCRTFLGSDTPEDSMMTRSYISPFSAATTSSFSSDSSSSSDAEQQAQPFSSCITSEVSISSPPISTDFCFWPSEMISFASMLTAAMSLTITPTLSPPLFCSISRRSVVLPDPRKPERSVIGIFGPWGTATRSPSTSITASDAPAILSASPALPARSSGTTGDEAANRAAPERGLTRALRRRTGVAAGTNPAWGKSTKAFATEAMAASATSTRMACIVARLNQR